MKRILALALCLALALPAASALAAGNIMGTLAGLNWSYSSGAGGWSTDLRIRADGSFSGAFHDSEIGESGEGYPFGTVYSCSFTGRMSLVGQAGENCWRIRIDALTPDQGQAETIEDGVRYVTAAPYGLSAGDEMLLYAPGTPVSALSNDMAYWAHIWLQDEPSAALETWFLWSELNGSGFVGE